MPMQSSWRAGSTQKAAIAIISGHKKVFVNDPSLFPMVMQNMGTERPLNHDIGVHKTAMDLQRLFAKESGRHFASLRDAIHHFRATLPNALVKRLQNLNTAHSFLKHYTELLGEELLRDVTDSLPDVSTRSATFVDSESVGCDRPVYSDDSSDGLGWPRPPLDQVEVPPHALMKNDKFYTHERPVDELASFYDMAERSETATQTLSVPTTAVDHATQTPTPWADAVVLCDQACQTEQDVLCAEEVRKIIHECKLTHASTVQELEHQVRMLENEVKTAAAATTIMHQEYDDRISSTNKLMATLMQKIDIAEKRRRKT
eukprot:TRINITY_DN42080_c0_g2_i1.p1 TRINITY_DN42080_c0_g2~~TRINITY_DN42080_c0_g2_i1.p1  ORF type:complete len:333 (+),score=46.67 TRINITY_DN42080_c0_g2_i1:54-1001(+)